MWSYQSTCNQFLKHPHGPRIPGSWGTNIRRPDADRFCETIPDADLNSIDTTAPVPGLNPRDGILLTVGWPGWLALMCWLHAHGLTGCCLGCWAFLSLLLGWDNRVFHFPHPRNEIQVLFLDEIGLWVNIQITPGEHPVVIDGYSA